MVAEGRVAAWFVLLRRPFAGFYEVCIDCLRVDDVFCRVADGSVPYDSADGDVNIRRHGDNESCRRASVAGEFGPPVSCADGSNNQHAATGLAFRHRSLGFF